MPPSQIFSDSSEYETRKSTPYSPPEISISELYAAVPKHLFRKSTAWGLFYTARDISFILVAYLLGCRIDDFSGRLTQLLGLGQATSFILRWSLWAMYWQSQGIFMASLWTLAHEAGHGTLSEYNWVNHVIGFVSHTSLLVPYYAWRSTHRAHHKKAMSLEDDENYVPSTRSHFNLPPAHKARVTDYHEIFEESPLYSLLKIICMQIGGLPAYLLLNKKGSPKYPVGTSHFLPSSPLFKPDQRNEILVSDIGIGFMALLLYQFAMHFGRGALLNLYFIPYLLANHWIVAITYIQHTDPTIPHYRKSEWSFLRGAVATVDRPALGWVGRFFLKNLSHDHVAHHLFSTIPFYNQPKVTELIKPVLKGHYNYDSTNTFWALYRTFTECRFIEDEGDIVFFKNKDGVAARRLQGEEIDEDAVQ